MLGAPQPVLVGSASATSRRRAARTALIVVGLMLGTTIIAAALTTGDTMSHTIRATAVAALGETDEVVSAKGAVDDIPGELGAATGTRVLRRRRSLRASKPRARGTGLVDGVAAAIIEQVALQAPAQPADRAERRCSSRADPAQLQGFAPIARRAAARSSLADLAAGEIFLNRKAAEELARRRGRHVRVFAGRDPRRCACATSSPSTAPGPPTPPLLVPLATGAAAVRQATGSIKHVLVSNSGGAIERRRGTPTGSLRRCAPVVAPLGLEVDHRQAGRARRAPTRPATRSWRSSRRSARSRSRPGSC